MPEIYSSASSRRVRRGRAIYGARSGDGVRPELADIGRLARRAVQRTVAVARAGEGSVSQLLTEHLAPDAAELPAATGNWPTYDQVNVQTALNAWVAEPGRTHRLVGLIQFRHSDFGLGDLLASDYPYGSPGVGAVAMDVLAAGPGGITLPCVECGIYLTQDEEGAAALLVRGPEENGRNTVTVEIVATKPGRAAELVEELRRVAVERSVFRGQVIAFGDEVFGHQRGALLSFLDRPEVDRDQVILPPPILDGIERQVLGVARHAARLVASGQHLRRGVLLYGAPGTGKTHTVRYLIGRLREVTVVLLSGQALGMIAEACSVARTLQPSVVVVEDVDLIAEERGRHRGQHPLLFELLNEMDGLGGDIDVTFLLTTNRADMLEHALAARPGRVDHAAELPLPDADARRRLLSLYRGGLDLDLADPEVVISRTEGVTASFIRELLRRAALVAAESDSQADEADSAPLHVTDEHLTAALDQLLDTRNALTVALLGGASGQQSD